MSKDEKILDIQIYGSEVLSQKAELIQELTPENKNLVEAMKTTMYENKGIGLAANQVGELKRIVIVDVDQVEVGAGGKGKHNPRVFINPEISSESDNDCFFNEGCLSLPGVDAEVYRPTAIEISYLDVNMKERKIQCDGLLARVLQHEVDHLNGLLFVDRLGFMKRTLLAGQLNKLKKLSREK